MNKLTKISIIVLWCMCSFVNWGVTLGYFTYKYPQYNHGLTSAIMALIGPGGTPVCVLASIGNYHWRLKPLSKEDSWKIYQEKYPGVSRDQFEQDY